MIDPHRSVSNLNQRDPADNGLSATQNGHTAAGSKQPGAAAAHPGDMPAGEFRAALHQTADIVADYLEHVREYAVLPKVQPGDIRRALPATPPTDPEPIERILADYRAIIEPNVTHWNHPGFMAYFPVTGSGPGILGEMLSAGLNVNAMLWRTGPAPTELEELVCDWLRQMIGMPAEFRGHINDTASVSSMLALGAARERAFPDVRTQGLSGRSDLPRMTVYCSDQAHSSIDKSCLALGLGTANLRRVETDEAFQMRPGALRRAIEQDLAAGHRPIAVVATVGTTSTTAIDPVREIAGLAREFNLWLHVDGAYAGSAGICPEFRARMEGIEQADSLVLNPHKWLFVPVDCSVLFVRDADQLRRSFSIIPDYLKTTEADVTNLMDYGIQLGRRFRALKLWMVMRSFGVSGLQARMRHHCALAREFADMVAADPHFELAAPVPFGTVCFRAKLASQPGAAAPRHENDATAHTAEDAFNERLLAEVNADGRIFISPTRLRGRLVLRLSIGNLRTTREYMHSGWELIRATAERMRG